MFQRRDSSRRDVTLIAYFSLSSPIRAPDRRSSGSSAGSVSEALRGGGQQGELEVGVTVRQDRTSSARSLLVLLADEQAGSPPARVMLRMHREIHALERCASPPARCQPVRIAPRVACTKVGEEAFNTSTSSCPRFLVPSPTGGGENSRDQRDRAEIEQQRAAASRLAQRFGGGQLRLHRSLELRQPRVDQVETDVRLAMVGAQTRCALVREPHRVPRHLAFGQPSRFRSSQRHGGSTRVRNPAPDSDGSSGLALDSAHRLDDSRQPLPQKRRCRGVAPGTWSPPGSWFPTAPDARSQAGLGQPLLDPVRAAPGRALPCRRRANSETNEVIGGPTRLSAITSISSRIALRIHNGPPAAARSRSMVRRRILHRPRQISIIATGADRDRRTIRRA